MLNKQVWCLCLNKVQTFPFCQNIDNQMFFDTKTSWKLAEIKQGNWLQFSDLQKSALPLPDSKQELRVSTFSGAMNINK